MNRISGFGNRIPGNRQELIDSQPIAKLRAALALAHLCEGASKEVLDIINPQEEVVAVYVPGGIEENHPNDELRLDGNSLTVVGGRQMPYFKLQGQTIGLGPTMPGMESYVDRVQSIAGGLMDHELTTRSHAA